MENNDPVKIGDIVLYNDKLSAEYIPAIVIKVYDYNTVSLEAFPENFHSKTWKEVKHGNNIGEWRHK